MLYIIFGAIAVVGLAFLIVYNLRVDAARKKREQATERSGEPPVRAMEQESAARPAQEEPAPPAEPAHAAVPAEAAASRPAAAAPVVREAAAERPKPAQPPAAPAVSAKAHSDSDYRQALRNFGGTGEQERQDESAETPPGKIPTDQQFREALRSMKNQRE
ncbi:hypothetical protein N0M98_05295 [Paenibacillus doosanensis]|uniref:Uncharacterized protein n=1 Tax=Paenibacillus konkukensis TaxID=2020716 RepID=A0ABY4RTD6_9BACL|nr:MULTISPECIES: hypothetical protein [Paenibacillus]MCS7459549.1 hypothetical protein [Paenibacillus doosanensis]UQZ84793.1 hypothetical protein SK3146_04048 [Paenibacillus konkukensis]